jgi:hypothetical protein
MVKDTTANEYALWNFDGTTISNATLAALRDKTQSCNANKTPWQPFKHTSTESFCGNGCETSCDSFFYGFKNCASIPDWKGVGSGSIDVSTGERSERGRVWFY